MELTWLEDCVALAETLNFSRAAELRHVTQPAFSRRVRALEQWLGTPLFKRSRRGVALTPAGEHFRAQATALVRQMHQLRNETREIAGRATPALTFAATHVLSFTFFPEWIRGHAQVSGLAAFKLVSDTMRACEQLLVQGGAQFLLCHHHPQMRLSLDAAQFRSIVVGQDQLVPLSAPATLGRPRWRLGADSKRTPWLAYSSDSGLGRILAGHAPAAAPLRKLTPVFTSDLAATLLAMARAGDGVAWLPRSLAARDIADGTLVDAAPAQSALRIPIEVRLFRPVARMPKAAEAVWAFFEAASAQPATTP
jgi:LysR family transcriptional regulator, hypochlorite-specific transcription factor HypT